MSAWTVGTELPEQVYRVTRADLIAYAVASGDANPIHQDEEIALAVGLPGVIAHGMYTLALAARAADVWAGAPGRVRDLGAKFTRPVVVPAGSGTELRVSGVVASIAEDGAAKITLTVSCGEEKVLGAASVVLDG
jgi:acyl dehydratase